MRKRWARQLGLAVLGWAALSAATTALDVDTNIDTGNNLAKGLFLVLAVWALVAGTGLLVSAVAVAAARRRDLRSGGSRR